jgi:hypothetical protein
MKRKTKRRQVSESSFRKELLIRKRLQQVIENENGN